MSKTNKAQAALPYAQRVLEDEYVQEQLRNAVMGLRTVYERARKERGKATEDKHVYGNLRHAATSIRNAATAIQRPKATPKRRFRKVAVLALSAGACVWLTTKLQNQQSSASGPATGTPPPA